MKYRFLFTGMLMLTAIVFSAGYLFISRNESEGFLDQRAVLVMRDIGHKLMLHAGDSSSRIMPVKRLGASVFEIRFQGPLTFVPDTLVKVVHGALASGNLPLNYIVNVRECNTNIIIYGYQMGDASSTLIPCLGRSQPSGCYTIQIAFVEQPSKNNGVALIVPIAMSAMAIAYAGIRLLRKKRITTIDHEHGTAITIGNYSFDADKRLLKFNNRMSELSDKESRLLKIFASNQNEVMDRDRLLKEVWEDDGVIVGRSLDVFVSKLRKKLQHDPAVKIVAIHGKGYKLENGTPRFG